MKDIYKLETFIASWYKDVPHLSKTSQVWLAENVWWLALIGVILGATGIFGVLSIALVTGVALIALGGVYGAILSGVMLIAALLFLALAIACLVLTALSISPLKAGLKKGWTLLFAVALVNVVALALNFLTRFDLFGLVWGLLMTALGGYLLFEIRDHFVSTGKSAKRQKPSPKKAA